MAKKKKTALLDFSKFLSIDDIKKNTESLGFISLSPNLDIRMGGGVQEGSFMFVRTLPKVGKTTLLSDFARRCAKQKRHVFYFDTESRLSDRNIFRECYSEEDLELMRKYIHFEQFKIESEFKNGNDIYNYIYQMMQIPEMNGSVYIIDSFGKIIPKEQQEDSEIRADRRDMTPKLNADFCKKIGNILRSSKSIVIGVQHYITDTGTHYGNPMKAAGGLKFDYDADYVLETKHNPLSLDGEKPLVTDEDFANNKDGNLICWQIPYNKIIGPIMTKKAQDGVHNYLRYDQGVWRTMEIFEILSKFTDIITIRGGGNYTMLMSDDMVSLKGKDKVIDFMEENLDYFEEEYLKFLQSKYPNVKYESSNKNPLEEPTTSTK